MPPNMKLAQISVVIMCPFGLASLPLNRDPLIANDYYPFSSIACDLNQERAAVYKRIVAAKPGACCLALGRDAASRLGSPLMNAWPSTSLETSSVTSGSPER